jgi:plasmid stability protein
MSLLQIRDFPDAEKEILAARAASRGQSLTAHLREVLIREASFERNRDLVGRALEIGSNSRFTLSEALSVIDVGRAGR